MEDFLSLSDFQTVAELLRREGGVDSRHPLVVDKDAALLDKPPRLRLGGRQFAGREQIKDGNLPIGQLAGQSVPW